MSDVPLELKYTKSHEWLRVEDDGLITVGISDHAQELLGDLVFVELPESGRALACEEDCAVVESVKAASDVLCPVDGEVLEINEGLEDSPELINDDPLDEGWILKIRMEGEPAEWMSPDDYGRMLEATD